jgi:hypothetical protein
VRVERTPLIELIDEVCATLDEGISPEEERAGWTPENRRIVTDVLAKLRARLEDPRPLRPGEIRPSLSRDIDDLGIGQESSLANQIARISNLANAAR